MEKLYCNDTFRKAWGKDPFASAFAVTGEVFRDVNPKRRGKATVQLGLHDCTGRAVYNLKTLQVRATPPLVPKVNAQDATGYSPTNTTSQHDRPRSAGICNRR